MDHEEAARILGVPAGASAGQVRRAWRMWARVAHPDVGGDAAHFARLDEARRILLRRRPAPRSTTSAPAPRASLRTMVRRPSHPARLIVIAGTAIIASAFPALSDAPLALAAAPAAILAGLWALLSANELLSPAADAGHRIAVIALAWIPIAGMQLLVSTAVGTSLLPVMPLVALPLAVVVAAMNLGAGFRR